MPHTWCLATSSARQPVAELREATRHRRRLTRATSVSVLPSHGQKLIIILGAVRAEASETAFMENKKPRPVRTASIVRNMTHGDVYNWLYRYRRSILRDMAEAGLVWSWAPAMKRMEEAGITRPSGKPITLRSISSRWLVVLANAEREEKKRASSPAKSAVRRHGLSIEPPSRPGMNGSVHVRGAPIAEAQPNRRKYFARQQASLAQPAASETAPPEPPALPQPPLKTGGRLTPAEVRANLDRQLRKIDGPQPQPIVRGRII